LRGYGVARGWSARRYGGLARRTRPMGGRAGSVSWWWSPSRRGPCKFELVIGGSFLAGQGRKLTVRRPRETVPTNLRTGTPRDIILQMNMARDLALASEPRYRSSRLWRVEAFGRRTLLILAGDECRGAVVRQAEVGASRRDSSRDADPIYAPTWGPQPGAITTHSSHDDFTPKYANKNQPLNAAMPLDALKSGWICHAILRLYFH
jgi:hypothetical protein